jgi:hypothetical protein
VVYGVLPRNGSDAKVVPGFVMRTGMSVRAEGAHGHGDDDGWQVISGNPLR